jgi:acyl-CoA thioester hydrolase
LGGFFVGEGSMSDNKSPSRGEFPVWTAIRVRFGDVDRNDHVNNVALAQYCEDARIDFRDQVLPGSGLDPAYTWVIVAFAISYYASLDYPGTAEVGTRVEAIGRSSFTLAHGIFRGDVCIAGATSKLVCLDRDTRKPRPLPDALAAAFKNV